jgi:2-polyprenyl-3-methyl-5-hydroxy-6-metoxy-1,4-benzoquinol methylase
MNLALLKGLIVTLNARLTPLRRNLEAWPEEKLREELALVAALVDEARPEIGRRRIAAQAEAAADLLSERAQIEIEPIGGYALWSETYHEQADNPLTVLECDVFDRLVGDVAGLRVLDVGCGTGRHALRLAERGAQVTGADPCPEMLAVARELAAQRGLPVEWLPVGYEDLPKASFDLVICNLVLCHVQDLAGAVAAMAACLRPGGRLVITDLHYFCLLIGWRTTFDHGDTHYAITNYLHPVSEYFAALRQAGLTLAAIEDILIEERLREYGMASIVDKWEGFPFGVALAALRA